MTENEANIYSIAYRDCKEVSDSIDVNEEFGKANTILFYMDEILESLKIASELHSIGTIEEFKALKDAEEQGLLLRLPCKVGDTVYLLMNGHTRIVACSVLWIEWHKKGIIVFSLDGGYGDVVIANLGKEWFLTGEEAEQALEKLKGGGTDA